MHLKQIGWFFLFCGRGNVRYGWILTQKEVQEIEVIRKTYVENVNE